MQLPNGEPCITRDEMDRIAEAYEAELKQNIHVSSTDVEKSMCRIELFNRRIFGPRGSVQEPRLYGPLHWAESEKKGKSEMAYLTRCVLDLRVHVQRLNQQMEKFSA